MKPPRTEDAPFTSIGGALSLSGTALLELLRAVLEKGMSFRFMAKGVSMWPFIKHGDVITISSLSGPHPMLGDVVIFLCQDTGKPMVHRVVGKKKDSFLMKGDNASNPDAPVPERDILGWISKVERDGVVLSFGLGKARFLIAFLSRMGLLQVLVHPVRKLCRFITTRLSQ